MTPTHTYRGWRVVFEEPFECMLPGVTEHGEPMVAPVRCVVTNFTCTKGAEQFQAHAEVDCGFRNWYGDFNDFVAREARAVAEMRIDDRERPNRSLGL